MKKKTQNAITKHHTPLHNLYVIKTSNGFHDLCPPKKRLPFSYFNLFFLHLYTIKKWIFVSRETSFQFFLENTFKNSLVLFLLICGIMANLIPGRRPRTMTHITNRANMDTRLHRLRKAYWITVSVVIEAKCNGPIRRRRVIIGTLR